MASVIRLTLARFSHPMGWEMAELPTATIRRKARKGCEKATRRARVKSQEASDALCDSSPIKPLTREDHDEDTREGKMATQMWGKDTSAASFNGSIDLVPAPPFVQPC